jgi:hypothetical protein
LLEFILGLYFTYERKHVVFDFLNLANLRLYSPVPSIYYLQMTKFHSFLWLNKIPLYINISKTLLKGLGKRSRN